MLVNISCAYVEFASRQTTIIYQRQKKLIEFTQNSSATGLHFERQVFDLFCRMAETYRALPGAKRAREV
jgi:hypothetical protein